MSWAGHVAHVEQVRYSHTVLVEKAEGKIDLGDGDVDRRII
jgi:hypothetical protein